MWIGRNLIARCTVTYVMTVAVCTLGGNNEGQAPVSRVCDELDLTSWCRGCLYLQAVVPRESLGTGQNGSNLPLR